MTPDVLPYGRQSIDQADIDAVVEVLRGDWLTTGPKVEQFERRLSDLSGGHFAVSCSSGTAALHTAYAALGIGPGDELVTTPMTFVATASMATALGATVVFADIEPDTALLSPEAAEAAFSDRTRAVVAVDYAGQPADYDRLGAVAANAGAVTVADAAHAIGSSSGQRPVGDLADVTTFSFFPTKNLTTCEGGAVIARNEGVARRAREFRGIGIVRDPARFELADEGQWHQEAHELGMNYRLSDVACALGLSQLDRLRTFQQRRREIFARYTEVLQNVDGLRLPVQRDDTDPMWHLFAVRVLDGRRREVFERMRAAGIGVQVNYLPVYWHPLYARSGYRRGLCPNAEAYYAEELSLPLFVELDDDDVDRVCEALVTSLR